jgi:hypothetical protein
VVGNSEVMAEVVLDPGKRGNRPVDYFRVACYSGIFTFLLHRTDALSGSIVVFNEYVRDVTGISSADACSGARDGETRRWSFAVAITAFSWFGWIKLR